MTTPIVPSITDEHLAELERLCTKATPGVRRIENDEDSCAGEVFVCAGLDTHSGGEICRSYSCDDADLIAATNPEVISALIARLRAAEKDAARYRLFSRMSEQLSQGLCLKGPERFLFESMNSVEKVTEQDLASMFDNAMEQSK